MNILLGHAYLNGYGGGERVFLEVAKHLSKRHNVSILTWEYVEDKTYAEFGKFEITQLKTFGAPLFKFLKWAAYKGDYDLVNVHAFPSNFLAFRNKNVFWVNHTDHASRGYGLYLNSGPVHRRLYARTIGYFDRLSAKKMKRVIANSKFCADFIRRYYGVEPVIVNPGIDPSEFSTGPFGNDVLLVSRVSPEKNIELGIRMMDYVNKNVNLVIVAGWVNREYIKSIRYDEKRIKILQGVSESEIKKLYSHCLTVIQTSVNEPFGIVPLEAMASGKPAVAPNRGGFTETITKETGFLLEPDPKTFAEKVNYLYENKEVAKRIGKMGLKRAREFDWSKKMKEMEVALGL